MARKRDGIEILDEFNFPNHNGVEKMLSAILASILQVNQNQ